MEQQPAKNRFAAVRMILGIVSLVLALVLGIQTSIVAYYNMLAKAMHGNGAAGYLVMLLLIVSGIIMIVTKNSLKKGGAVTSGLMGWFCFFVGRMMCEHFPDLQIYGFLAFAFGTFYLVSCMRTKKGLFLTLGIALVYFIIGIL